ncbi:MAG TPA: hypothetical protein VF297_03405 [Pyrinomonadaceae bacterium]
MFVDKHTLEELRSLRVKLDQLDRQEYGRRIEELQEANRRLESAHIAKTDELQKTNHKLAVHLSSLQGVAAVLFAVLSGIVIYYVDRYHTEVKRGREYAESYVKFDAVRAEAYDVQLGMLQDKMGDTLDRISLFAPTEEDRTMVTEVDALRQKLRRMGVESERFDALSELTNALQLIVNEGKAKEAKARLDEKALTVSSDRFVASRALVLQAMTLVQPSQHCVDTAGTITLVSSAIRKDSGVAAAFNLLGVCQAEEARVLIDTEPESWRRAGALFSAALRNNELAYQLKPTQWSRARLLNNRVWETSVFLLAALTRNRLEEALPWTGFKTVQEFIERSARDLEECQMFEQRLPTYLETLAELHGLECAFYRSPPHGNSGKAAEAYEKMVQVLTNAINEGLLRKMSGISEAEQYFSEDCLLAPLFAEPGNPRTLDPHIKALIEQHTRPH